MEKLMARALVLHNDIFRSMEVSENYVATIASQKLPTEMDQTMLEGADWKQAYSDIVALARDSAQKIRSLRPVTGGE